MPKILRLISYSSLMALFVAAAIILFGPQQGLETLLGGLFAYFVLLYHIAIGPIYLFYWHRSRTFSMGLFFMFFYLFLVYVAGFVAYINYSGMDDTIRDKINAFSDKQSHQLRVVSKRFYIKKMSGGVISEADLVQWEVKIKQAEYINKRDSEHHPALWYASAVGNTEIIKSLLERGALVNDNTLYPNPPLFMAVAGQHFNGAVLLIDAGANVNIDASKNNKLLNKAINNLDAKTVKLLIENGVNVSNGNENSFDLALRKNQKNILELLIDAGAKPSKNRMISPLEEAFEYNYLEIVSLLLKKTEGFNIKIKYQPPLLFKPMQNCDVKTFGSYLSLGADPNTINERGNSVLHELITFNTRACMIDGVRLDFVEALIKAGGNIDILNAQGKSLLISALRYKRLEMAKKLVHAGAKLDGKFVGKDFLMLAATLGDIKLIDFALANGFDLNHWSNSNSNALHEAAKAGHKQVVVYMIKKGAILPSDQSSILSLFRFSA